ncbi:MAG TPA: hypothetical protein VGR11_00390 [Solirubrobacteraceae bacterium]|nr:hypothetical protein [Solirubrobacteraceae bacterium]
MPPVIALVAGSILSLAGTGVASAAGCYSQTGCTETARSAKNFTSSVGINTHLGYSQSIYWQNWPMVRDRLLELGVSHIRDGTFPASYPDVIGPTVAARYNELGANGIKGNLLVGHEQAMTPTTLAQRLAWVRDNVAAFTMSIEGSNEFDTQGGDPGRIASLRAMQCEIHQRVNADPVLASKPVIGPSSGNFHSDDIWYGEIGDLSACLDKGNLHPYSGADPPHRRLSRDLSIAMSWGRTTFGDKPLWATESGYINVPGSAGVSETAAGTYIPRAMLENFRRGIERTQSYELVDLQTGSDQGIDNYGLLRTDGTRKPAFSALRNLLSIVSDSAAASGSLGFGIVCTANCRDGDPNAYPTQDGPIRHVLLKHSTGAYFLAVWSESQVWDAAAGADTPKAPQSFRLHLHQAPAKVEIFDPHRSRAALSTDTSGSQIVSTAAPDSVRLIKITPAAAPAPSAEPLPVLAPVPPIELAPAVGLVPPAAPAPSVAVTPLAPPAADDAAPPAPATACIRPKAVARIAFSKARHRNVRAHYMRAVRRGWPRTLVVNRRSAQRRSARLLKNSRSVKGRSPVAYPPAVGRGRGGRGLTRGKAPAGWRAHVAYLPSRERRSHDAILKAKLTRFCDGTRFRYIFR